MNPTASKIVESVVFGPAFAFYFAKAIVTELKK